MSTLLRSLAAESLAAWSLATDVIYLRETRTARLTTALLDVTGNVLRQPRPAFSNCPTMNELVPQRRVKQLSLPVRIHRAARRNAGRSTAAHRTCAAPRR